MFKKCNTVNNVNYFDKTIIHFEALYTILNRKRLRNVIYTFLNRYFFNIPSLQLLQDEPAIKIKFDINK